MAKPPKTPPSGKERGAESDTPAADQGAQASAEEEVTRRGSGARPPDTRR